MCSSTALGFWGFAKAPDREAGTDGGSYLGHEKWGDLPAKGRAPIASAAGFLKAL